MAQLDGQTMQNRLRLGSGLVMFVFVTGHLLNHVMGLISLEVMQAATVVFTDPWQTWPGMVLLVGALLAHAGIVLWGFWCRRNFRLKAWEAVQLVFGLAIPPFLAAHVAANGILPAISTYPSSYIETLSTFAVYSPVRGVLMGLAVLVVWTHGCVGLHSWLRLQPWYARYQSLAFSAALIIPAMALAGYLAASMRVRVLAQEPGGLQAVFTSLLKPWMVDFVYDTEIGVIVFILALLAARAARGVFLAKSGKVHLDYTPGNRVVDLLPGATLLESIRAAGIPHASICGGRGRCSTCRVHIGDGLEDLPPPDEAEKKVLARVTDSTSVRLACQIRPLTNIQVTALVAHDAKLSDALAKPGYQQGKELVVAILFVDLRGSTTLSENRLPFDVVFLLNQFFSELEQALAETNGHFAQFNGDGLMAIYGLDSGAERGTAESIAGALAMLQRLTKLNEKLGDELSKELKIGIGIHTGVAIVGSMGPSASPTVSALGDSVNVAARLEAQTKEFGVPLVVSAETAEFSKIDFSKFPKHRIQVKGRERKIVVYAVDKPETLSVAS
jgi:adenylate cyclase